MKTKTIGVDPNNPKNMFEDSKLVGKIISVKYGTSSPQEYLVIGISAEENYIGFKVAAVIRWHPIKSNSIEAFTAESLPGKPLHLALLETVSKEDPDSNYKRYKKELQGVKQQ